MQNKQPVDHKCVRMLEGQYSERVCGGNVVSQVGDGGCSAKPPKCLACGAEYPIVSIPVGESVISMPDMMPSGFSFAGRGMSLM